MLIQLFMDLSEEKVGMLVVEEQPVATTEGGLLGVLLLMILPVEAVVRQTLEFLLLILRRELL